MVTSISLLYSVYTVYSVLPLHCRPVALQLNIPGLLPRILAILDLGS